MIVGLAGLAGSGKDTVADILVKNFGFVKVAFADPLKRIAKEVYDFTDEQLWGPSSARNKPDTRYWRMPFSKEFIEEKVELWHASSIPEDPNHPDHVPLADFIGLTQEQYAYWVETGGYLTPRYALQQLGSEWGRDCYPNTWVDYALRTADTLLYKSGILRSQFFSYTPQEGLISTYVPVSGCRPRGIVISDVRFLNELDAIRKWGGGFGGKGKVIKVLRGKGLTGTAANHRSEKELVGMSEESFDTLIDNRETTLAELEAQVSRIAQNRLGL